MDILLADPINPMPERDRMHQLTMMWQGLRAIEAEPNPTRDDWGVCSDAVNLMETLITMGIVDDSSGLLNDAIAALALAGKRNLEGKPIRLDARGIQAVRAVLEDYATCLNTLPHRTMIRCHRDTETRLLDILRGRKQAHDVCVVAM